MKRRSSRPRRDSGTRESWRADTGFLAYVLEQLNDLGDVESRAMFGGHGLYRRDIFFGIVHRGRLYFRVDDSTRGEYQARGMTPFRAGRQTLGSYFEVPTEVLESFGEIARWARRAADRNDDREVTPRGARRCPTRPSGARSGRHGSR